MDLKLIVAPYLFEACIEKEILNYQNSDLENLEITEEGVCLTCSYIHDLNFAWF